MSRIIMVSDLVRDYDHVAESERWTADLIAEQTGGRYTACDFGPWNEPRSEYDYCLEGPTGRVKCEQKTSAQDYLSLEYSKDSARQILSGIGITEAPLIVFLSRGLRKPPGTPSNVWLPDSKKLPCGKIRIYHTKKLLAAMLAGRFGPPTMRGGASESQNALVFRMHNPFDISHIHLGDVDIVRDGNNTGYDLDTFIPNLKASALLNYTLDIIITPDNE